MLFVSVSCSPNVSVIMPKGLSFSYVCMCARMHTHTWSMWVYVFAITATCVCSVLSIPLVKSKLWVYIFSRLFCSSLCWLLHYYPIKNSIIQFSKFIMCFWHLCGKYFVFLTYSLPHVCVCVCVGVCVHLQC